MSWVQVVDKTKASNKLFTMKNTFNLVFIIFYLLGLNKAYMQYYNDFKHDFKNDFKHDLKVGMMKEKELGEIFQGATIEVKYDLKAPKTGNVFVEYKSRDKLSGLSTTDADYYCFCLGDTFHIIKTEDLKKVCRPYFNTNKDVKGGDSNTSKGILLPIKELF
jgi:hypothetical protein